ncbi:MAG TPA: flagellar biosynthesis protein FlhB [Syntrophomonadaceae bacterium]|nr:flagellar biosynthesis protein FlhB [Syntrophomonadaceae bacterium]
MKDTDIKKYLINLQLFAEDDGSGEKTEAATPRRREEARKKGQVFKSVDLNSAVILLVGMAAIFASFSYMTGQLKAFTALYLLDRTTGDFDNQYACMVLGETILLTGKMLLPILGSTFMAALLITYFQVGFVFSGEALVPKLERLNPIEGFKRIFSRRALVELIKSLLKVIVTGFIVYSVIRKNFYIFPSFMDMDLGPAFSAVGNMILEMAIKVGIVYIVIGIVDYLYQWYEYEKSLKMSKYDVKQEYKQIEGDPQVKSRQRQIQREVAMRRMMSEVPKADVVITNPTHFAVALKYDSASMKAPQVVAKGQDFIAQKIREVAREHQVTIIENPPLARLLYKSVEIGDVIPEDLYQAVAEVLAFVYKQKKVSV